MVRWLLGGLDGVRAVLVCGDIAWCVKLDTEYVVLLCDALNWLDYVSVVINNLWRVELMRCHFANLGCYRNGKLKLKLL